MTFEIPPETDPEVKPDLVERTERLHEFLLNQQGYDTEHVLVKARSNGRITVEIEDTVSDNDVRRIRGLIADLSEAISEADWNSFSEDQMEGLLSLQQWLDRLEP